MKKSQAQATFKNMANALKVYGTAKHTADKLTKWAEAPGRSLFISWKWEGRSRSGVLNAYDPAGTICNIIYFRNSQKWTDADEMISSVKNGSRKHKAMMALCNILKI